MEKSPKKKKKLEDTHVKYGALPKLAFYQTFEVKLNFFLDLVSFFLEIFIFLLDRSYLSKRNDR